MALAGLIASAAGQAMAQETSRTADLVNPLIGSGNGGNTFPGASMPFGMLQWSPENTRGKHDAHGRARRLSVRRHPHPRVQPYPHLRHRLRRCQRRHSLHADHGAGDQLAIRRHHRQYLRSDFATPTKCAKAGDYRVRLANGVMVGLCAAHCAAASHSFEFPAGKSGQPVDPRYPIRKSAAAPPSVQDRQANAHRHRIGDQRQFLRLSGRGGPAQLLHAVFRGRVRPAVCRPAAPGRTTRSQHRQATRRRAAPHTATRVSRQPGNGLRRVGRFCAT